MSPAMQRAKRSARAVRHGVRILTFVGSPKARAKLVTIAESGLPPVTAISSELQKLVGATGAKLVRVKQFTGLCVRAVLEEEGFELAGRGVRTSTDPVFRTASVYKRSVVAANTDRANLLARLLDTLTDVEAKQAAKLLNRRISTGAVHWVGQSPDPKKIGQKWKSSS